MAIISPATVFTKAVLYFKLRLQIEIEKDERYSFQIRVDMNSTGNYFWRVQVNDGQHKCHEEEIPPPETYPAVLLYLSDPNFSPLTNDYGLLDNLKIFNKDKEIDHGYTYPYPSKWVPEHLQSCNLVG